MDYNFNKLYNYGKAVVRRVAKHLRNVTRTYLCIKTINGGSLDSFTDGKDPNITPSEKAEWVWAYVDFIYNGGNNLNNGGGGYTAYSYKLPILRFA